MNPPVFSRFNHDPRYPPLESSRAGALSRKQFTFPHRTGITAIKKGMMGIFDKETGERIPCTVLQMDRLQVVGHKTKKANGYYAVQVGSGSKNPMKTTRAELGHFHKNEVPPKADITEFRVKGKDGLVPIGTCIRADWLIVGQFVDVKATSKGKGFAGGMKRHGWKGQPASHGNSLAHRAMGSSGAGQGGGSRVIPGKKMPGRMGGHSVTVCSLKVVQVDAENDLILVKGAVPGPRKGMIKIKDALRKAWPDVPSIPAHLLAQKAATSDAAAEVSDVAVEAESVS
ncbi:translation protein [Eremomyces bilateralis CBS 781.70]|uniref:Large ribosomal subunit protein uL3m n=1 Tax=Eremomyces bilateralis CBS 781.70 TaxID=1392243 RepID=A0A6G1G9X2_9PEZI|nr:translation protein [Eremomyces bilateralis CBS 781.70]KAF1814659.1 translation protein [Eremomyces bilateralis CBS 781.70]